MDVDEEPSTKTNFGSNQEPQLGAGRAKIIQANEPIEAYR